MSSSSIPWPPLSPVELVMSVEETFGLEIPDSDAEKLRSIGDLKAYVWTRVQHGGDETCRTQQKFYRVRRVACSVLGIDRARIQPDTTWASILPERGRRRAWNALRRGLGAQLLRPEGAPGPGLWFVLTVCCPGLLVLLVDSRQVEAAIVVTLVVASLGVAFGVWKALQPNLPRLRRTVGGTARLAAAVGAAALPAGQRSWSRDEVDTTIDKLVVQATGYHDFNDTQPIHD